MINDYDVLINIMWDLFNSAYFNSFEDREEYLEELKLISDEETIKNKILDLNNRNLNRITHIGRYNMSDLNKHIKNIL